MMTGEWHEEWAAKALKRRATHHEA
jgi:hypothetical protein